MTDAGNLALLGRVMGGLIVVLVLIGLAARVARRSRGRTNTTGLRVVDRIGLSRDANLTVVEVANRMLLLGVTAQGVTLLADLDAVAERDDDPEPEASGVLTTGVTPSERPERPEPPRTPPAQPRSQRRPVPSAVALEEYPDLASALRAAGRTTSAAASSETGAEGPSPTPRTRAEARAEARARASVAAQNPAPAAAPAAITPRPGSTVSSEVDRIPQPRNQSGGKKRVVHRPTPQASGSVLSPRTWRQGIEALRDLTVRRG